MDKFNIPEDIGDASASYSNTQRRNSIKDSFFTLIDENRRDYKALWIKAKNKIVATNRMKKIISDIKQFGATSVLFRETTISDDKLVTYLTRKSKFLGDFIDTSEKYTIPRTVFHPTQAFISSWNITMALILLYTAIVDPFVLSFMDSSKWDPLFVISIIFDFTFMFDMAITFNTAYYNEENQIIGSRKKIALKYLKGWFILDIASSVPFGLLEAFLLPSGNNAARLVRISRLRNIPKLLRLSRLVKIAKNLSYLQDIDFIISMNQRILRFIKVISGIILCVHVTACLWHLTAKMDNFSVDTWVVRFGYVDAKIWIKYQTSVYWALTTLTTLGYGDIYPLTTTEKLLAMLWMLFAVYFLSFSIGSLTTMFADMDSRDRIINEKLLLVDEFFHSTQLSVDIMHKLKRSIRLSTDIVTFNLEDKDSLFDKLPISLKLDLAKSMFNNAIKRFLFFTLRDEIFVASVAVYLENSLLCAGQTIWNAGEPSNGIYFILSGRIHFVFGEHQMVFKALSQDDYFGDIEVIQQEVRKFTTISVSQSQCLVLPKPVVLRIQNQFPSVWSDLVDVTKTREKKLYSGLAEMKVLYESYKNKEIKRVQNGEIKMKIKEEYEILVEEAKERKKSKKQKQIEQIESQIEFNLESIKNLEARLKTILANRNRVME